MNKTTPWLLITELDDQNQLFSGILNTSYKVYTFSCSCGHVESITLANDDKNFHYVCLECGNSVFYDANAAKRNIEFFISFQEGLNLQYDYSLFKFEYKIEARLATNIPENIDFVRKKVNLKPKILNSVKLNFNGLLEDNALYLFSSEKIYKKLEGMINDYLNENASSLNIPNQTNEKLNIKKASFFFRHKNLKEFEFYNWIDLQYLPNDRDLNIDKAFEIIINNRKEKSLKKAVFNNYKIQMEDNQQYAPYLAMLFIKKIKDINILVRFLKLSLHKYNILKYNVALLLDFLLVAYTDKQIFHLFHQLESDDEYNVRVFNDLLRQLSDLSHINQFYNEQKKPKCNLYDLHDSISEYARREKEKEIIGKTIDTSKHNLKSCVKIDNYSVALPKTGDELYEWAGQLQNCMASYFKAITNNETSIYCFLKNENIDFAVEISNKHVLQASGIANARLNPNQKKVLTKWLKRFFGPESVSLYKNPIPIEVVCD